MFTPVLAVRSISFQSLPTLTNLSRDIVEASPMRRPEASVSTVSARNSLAVSIESIASNQYLLDLFVSEWQNVGVFDLCGLDGFGGVFLNPIGIEAELKEAVQSFQGLRGCSGVQLPCGTEVLQWVNVKLPQEHQAMVLTERCQGAVQQVVLSLREFPETARIGIGRELLNCVFDGHRRSAPGDARGLHLSGAQLGHLPVRRAHRLLQSLLADPPIEPHGAPTLPVGEASDGSPRLA